MLREMSNVYSTVLNNLLKLLSRIMHKVSLCLFQRTEMLPEIPKRNHSPNVSYFIEWLIYENETVG